MIPFWYLPYAIACGNTYIIKPSERCPMTMQRAMELIDSLGLPSGVVNLVNGSADTVNAILDHPVIRAVTFVGSTPVARHIYSRSAASGKRVQAQGGAKNPVIILPDADLSMTTRIVADSAFGSAGQRCLASSMAITVAEARKPFIEAISEVASSRAVGYGLNPGVEMGPVITPQSRERILGLVDRGLKDGARVAAGGRAKAVSGYERGNFLEPTVLQDIAPESELAGTEVFGPVLGIMHVDTIEDALKLVNSGKYGNQACVFTSSGAADVGINIGVAAPMAFFPFSGWKDSFFGDLHGQGKHAVEFFTQTKVVVERWPSDWSRKF
jgi:malonate-semialdehyde dehydrogenase (acetylating)/methylmalonate-semialdehyde dehydrogenase